MMLPFRPGRRRAGLYAAVFAVLLTRTAGAAPMTLDQIYGGIAKGCRYDQADNYRIITSYVDESSRRPQLTHPDGGKRLAPFLGRAGLEVHGESYTLTIPVAGATLYGIPVSQLAPYRGIGSGIAGIVIRFPVRVEEVRARLDRAGVVLESHDHGWGEIEPVLEPTEDGLATELNCDLSM